MAKVTSTPTGTTITLDVDELLRVVGGYIAPEVRKKLPKYEEQFRKSEAVKITHENGTITLHLLRNCDTILK